MSMNYNLALHTLKPAHAQLQAALDRITFARSPSS